MVPASRPPDPARSPRSRAPLALGEGLPRGRPLIPARTARTESEVDWPELLAQVERAEHALDLARLARRARRLELRLGLPGTLIPARVALLPGASSQWIAEPLRVALLAAGLAPELHVAPYDQQAQQMLDPASATSAFAPGLVLIQSTLRSIPCWPAADDGARRADELAREACEALLGPCERLHQRLGCEIILDTFAPQPFRPDGNLGAKRAGNSGNFIRRVNLELGDRAPSYVHLNDVAALVEQHGLRRWLDLPYWYHGKQPIAFGCVPEYVRSLAAIAGACLGRSRKCLVLDLDNTLWGGAIGELGIGGIQLGEGSPLGEAFQTFQRYVKELAERGVLLAVCSKNDEHVARQPFECHPEMVLRLSDVACFVANWRPKSENLERIARELGLGLDAFVLADDDPVERAQVRGALREVAVPELGPDPAEYPRALDRGRYFETVAVSQEDRARTRAYRQTSSPAELSLSELDLDAFLESLAMRAVVEPFEPVAFERIRQLANKTNQFNLTARRITSGEVAAIATDPARLARSVRLSDRFGPHGLISVFVGARRGDVLEIDLWLMSCRVIHRGVEDFLMNEIVAAARAAGVRELRGSFVPSPRNALVKEHYARMGFDACGEEGGVTRWSLQLERCAARKTHVRRVETFEA